MPKQPALPGLRDAMKKKQTRRERFLADMDAATIRPVLPGLAPEGRLVLQGVGKDPLAVSTGFLVGGERAVIGSITGSPHETERTLDFGVLTGARPVIETLPLDRAQEACDRMRSGEVTYRAVLTMGESHADQ